jgi:hypothetical protein
LLSSNRAVAESLNERTNVQTRMSDADPCREENERAKARKARLMTVQTFHKRRKHMSASSLSLSKEPRSEPLFLLDDENDRAAVLRATIGRAVVLTNRVASKCIECLLCLLPEPFKYLSAHDCNHAHRERVQCHPANDWDVQVRFMPKSRRPRTCTGKRNFHCARFGCLNQSMGTTLFWILATIQQCI